MPGEPAYNNLISRIRIGDTSDAENSIRASAIPYGQVDSTSTATAFTATVPGINVLRDGVCVLLKNGVVTSASGFTINVNGLGAKPSYTNLAAATRDTTIFNIGYTMLFIYDEDRVSGGCWICYRGYDANTNTIGYQIRSNSSTLPAADKGYRYRLWFTSADGSKWVPANKSASTDSTTSRTPNTTPIDPFGPIVYNSTNGTVNANANLPAATIWQQYTLTIGYSFNEPGGAMAYPAPVYLKCTPQTNGSAVMSELVQALPSTDDGFIYILLGRAYSATAIELIIEHPVFYNDGTGIRAWTGKKPFSGSYTDLTNKPSIPTKTSDLTNDEGYITSASVPSASSTTPKMDGTAAVGTETAFARGDHVHPTDTSRASLDIVAPEWAPNVDYWEWDSVIYQGQLYFCNEGHVSSSTWDSSKWTPITVGGLAYTMMSEKIDDPSTKTSGQFLKYNGTTWVAGDVPEGSAASSTTPKMDGTASTGSENAFARGDHVHPTDTSRQVKITASGILKGDGSGGVTAATAGTDYMTPANVSSNYVPLSKSSAGSTVTITDNPSLSYSTFDITAANGSYSSKLDLYVDPDTGSQVAYLQAGSNTLRVSNTATTIKNVTTPSADGDAANKKYVDDSIGALDGGTIGTGSTTKTITSLSQSNGNVSATFSDIAFPVTSVNGQTGAVTTAEKFVITATAISGTEYYNLDKTFADINVAIGHNKYVTIEDIDATYPYTTTVSQGVVFGATLIATGEGNQLMAVTDGILVVQPDSGTNAMGIAVHSTNVLPTMSDIPSASNTTPLMDGTADVGIQTYIYARADHVHPTDTSRQATLVSGTNIKTINNESILGSGNISISAGTSNIFVAEYGTTTYAEISTALNGNKLLFCHVSWNNIVCPYIGVVNSQYAFSNLGAGESTVSLYVNSSDTWSYATSNLATKITASGILKGDGLGTVTAAVAGTDYGAVIRRWTDVS